MRIVALTFGTEGDTRPMLALCRGLVDAGHDVVLLAERSGQAYAASLGVPFVALAGDMAAELRAASEPLLDRGGDVKFVAHALAGIATRNTAEWMRATLEHASGADAILCAGLAIYVGLSCAERLRIPAIGAALQPMMATRAFGSPFLPPRRLPGWINRASHRLVLAMMWRAFRGAINDARRDVAQQPARRREWDGYPIVFGISPTLVPRPPDWPARFSITGYWWSPSDAEFSPDTGLAAFLAAGEPPVYVGFGSMLGFDRDRMQRAVLEALDGRRALLYAGWSDFAAGALPATAHRIGHVPHAWLFPRVALAVHHGGAGTTHAAARAGIPSVVLPFAADQFFWAERLWHLGIAPKYLAHRDITASRLRERLVAASAPDMRERANGVASSIAAETGVATAVARIEATVRAVRAA
jgi:UDP:flavonoid glycosyltransferase YjiC (YdhE family)